MTVWLDTSQGFVRRDAITVYGIAYEHPGYYSIKVSGTGFTDAILKGGMFTKRTDVENVRDWLVNATPAPGMPSAPWPAIEYYVRNTTVDERRI